MASSSAATALCGHTGSTCELIGSDGSYPGTVASQNVLNGEGADQNFIEWGGRELKISEKPQGTTCCFSPAGGRMGGAYAPLAHPTATPLEIIDFLLRDGGQLNKYADQRGPFARRSNGYSPSITFAGKIPTYLNS